VSTKASAGAGDSGDRRDLISAELNPANIEIAARTQAPHGATRPLDAIVVGDRHRRELGDIERLAGSIAKIGLLHPIVITPANVLIAGERRLAAVKALGWDRMPVTVVNLAADPTTFFSQLVRKARVSDQYVTSDFPTADPSVTIGMRATNTSRGPPTPPQKRKPRSSERGKQSFQNLKYRSFCHD
jgi:ParB family chromosome partitioning protein